MLSRSLGSSWRDRAPIARASLQRDFDDEEEEEDTSGVASSDDEDDGGEQVEVDEDAYAEVFVGAWGEGAPWTWVCGQVEGAGAG